MEGTRSRHVQRFRKSNFHMIRYYHKTWQKGRLGLGYKIFSRGNLHCTFVDPGVFITSNDRHKSQSINAFIGFFPFICYLSINSSVLRLIKTRRITRFTFIETYVISPRCMACLNPHGSSAVPDFRQPMCIGIGSASKFCDEGKGLIYFLIYLYLN